MTTALNLRNTPVKIMNDKLFVINFSIIEPIVYDYHIMNNIQMYFNMEYYQFTNELVNSDLEIVGWEYKSGDKTLIVDFDHKNCANFYN